MGIPQVGYPFWVEALQNRAFCARRSYDSGFAASSVQPHDQHSLTIRYFVPVAMVAAELMEAEISTEIGAGRGEVCPERQTHRNGYRPRLWRPASASSS